VVNGAMVFDKDTLSPTYELRIGKPGSSYAFEIARKNGLSEELLTFASKRMGEAEKNFDELLVGLQKEKQETVEARVHLIEERMKLDVLIRTYEQMSRTLELEKKKLLLQAREQALAEVQESVRATAKALKELRETENARLALEKARDLLEKQKSKESELVQAVQESKKEVSVIQRVEKPATLAPGCTVRLREGGSVGTIERLSGEDAWVLVGNMRLKIKSYDLLPVEQAEKPEVSAASPGRFRSPIPFDDTLDIRGMRHEDAMKTLESFFDRALMANSHTVQVIHGLGGGVLRNLVRKVARGYRDVTQVRSAEPNNGGEGVTIVDFG
jgi:DNA mismatch repair protein MutS2